MNPQTFSINFNDGKVIPIQCVKDDTINDLEIENICFLLMIIYEGSAYFQVGAARAAFFPSISLTGSLGVESTELGSLFSGSSQAWSFGGMVNWPLLTFGRTLGSVRQSEAAMRETAAAYEKTVQQAFRDIREALAVQRGMAEGAETLARAAERMTKAAELARKRYAAG